MRAVAASCKLLQLHRCLQRATPFSSFFSTAATGGGVAGRKLNLPSSVEEVPCIGGVATMLHLPYQRAQPQGLDACFVGIPMDIGCGGGSGCRNGPRAVRDRSCRISAQFNLATGALPYESLNVADIGDVPINQFSLLKSVDIITEFFDGIVKANCIPLCVGGDHTITLPILRAMKKRYGPVGLVHVDAHLDLREHMMGEKICHGTPLRRALEEDLLSARNMVQIGISRCTNKNDFKNQFLWAKKQGIRVIRAEECWHKSLAPLMESVREQMGDVPVYLSFDIDGIDPSFCPGTDSPEIGGLTIYQALEVVRGCKGLNLVGADLVEVNPFQDPTSATTTCASQLLFEMLCVLPGMKYLNIEEQ